MAEGKEYKIKIGDKLYLMKSDDQYLEGRSIFEPELITMFKPFINLDSVIFDIGANIGCTSIYFGERAKNVKSFEPSPSTFKFLETNIKQSGLNNVELYNIGLGAKEETTTLTFSPQGRSGGFVSNMTQASKGHVVEEIKIRTLDQFVNETGVKQIDFVKIDVEGFEGHVIEGGRKTIEKHRPFIILELNHWCLNAFQRTSVPDFFDFLRSIFPVLYAFEGKSLLNLHDESQSYIVMHQHITGFKYNNIIAGFHQIPSLPQK